MVDRTFAGYEFVDFTFAPNTGVLNAAENIGNQFADGGTITVSDALTRLPIIISDNDATFDDGASEQGGAATFSRLAQSIVVNGQTLNANLIAENEFVLNLSDGTQLLFISFGAQQNIAPITIIMSTRPLVPGEVLTVVNNTDLPSTPFAAIICFAGGTGIMTPQGRRPVEALAVGDHVVTADGREVPVRWVGHRHVGAAELAAFPALRPICIQAGALGDNTPATDLRVSPQHRMILRDWRADLMFGAPDVLVIAKALVNDSTIRVDDSCTAVDYYHILFDQHEIILAEGAEAESFFPGEQALASLSPATRAELETLFPELLAEAFGDMAAPMLKPFETRALLSTRS